MGKDGPKQRVTTYNMSLHLGLCVGPIDALHEVYVGERPIGGVYAGSDLTEILIDKRQMFGGIRKEGGVRGKLTYLPGKADQLMTAEIAEKFGKTPTTMPGYRGVASLFFSGHPEKVKHISGKGFYWTANSPYLRDIWAKVTSIPKDWYPEKAAIPRNLVGPASFYFLLDRSNSLSTAEFAAIKSAVNSGLDLIEDFMESTGNRVDIGVRFYSSGSAAIERTNCDASDIQDIRDFIAAAAKVTGGDVLSAMEFVEDWFLATVGDEELTKRALIFVTDTNSEDSMEAAAAGPAADMLDQSAGVFSGVTSVDMYAVNYVSTETQWTSLLDNTPGDGVPIISSSDEAGLTNAVLNALNGRELDANPIHIIYDCLTNRVWGMGGSAAQINEASFTYAADVCFQEKFGLSLMWVQQAKIEDFVKEVVDHIEGHVFINPRTGLWEIKLVRNDYDPDALDTLDKTNCRLIDHQLKLYGEGINEIVVTWTNPANEKEETVALQDPGAIAIAGLISGGRNYYGVHRADLAMQLCERDLRAVTAPLASATVDVDRSKIDLTPGSVVKLNFPEDGIHNRIMRVGPVDYGGPKAPSLRLSLVEDVFSTPEIQFTEPPKSEWEDPTEQPAPIAHTEVITLPAFLVGKIVDTTAASQATYPEVFAGVLAAQAGQDTAAFDLYAEVTDSLGGTEWDSVGTRRIVSRATLGAALAAEAQSGFDASNITGMTQGDGPVLGGLAFIGSGTDETMEIVAISAFATPNYTFERGVLDTVPQAWPAGTPIWFVGTTTPIHDNTRRAAFETVEYKVLPVTSAGTLDEAKASIVSETLNERPWLPLRPADVKVNGASTGPVDATVGSLEVTFVTRNRLTENSQVLRWTDAGVTPEAGQTAVIELYDDDTDTLLQTYSAVTSPYTVPPADYAGYFNVKVKVLAERDGLRSLQGYEIAVIVAHSAPVNLTPPVIGLV